MPTIPQLQLVDLTTARFYMIHSHGYSKTLERLPVEENMPDATIAFYEGKDVMVLPAAKEYQTPTPRLARTERYARFLFNLTNWSDRLLVPDLRDEYAGGLSPSDWMAKHGCPFRFNILPMVVRTFKRSSFATPHRAHHHVRCYTFDFPNVKPVAAHAPANATGPYELNEDNKGNLFYVAYWESMTETEQADFIKYMMRVTKKAGKKT